MKRALLVCAGTLLCPALALADAASGPDTSSAPQAGLDPDAPPTTVHLVDDAEPEAPLIPPARDVLGSHLLVGAAVSPTWSLGKLASDVAAVRGLGTGIGARADAGVGLSRWVSVGLWGGFTSYTDGDRCDSCGARAFSIGPFVRYHLSQGLRFNPWLSLGGGYRQVSFKDSAGGRQSFSGVEWLRLELGADYYAFSGFALGPYGAVSLSSYTKRPDNAGDASVNTELSVGLRLLLDLPGR